MGAVADQVEAELDRLGALESVDGQIALRLADRLDSSRSEIALAQNSKELRAVMQAIHAAKPAEKGDPIVDLNARRAARGSTPKAG